MIFAPVVRWLPVQGFYWGYFFDIWKFRVTFAY